MKLARVEWRSLSSPSPPATTQVQSLTIQLKVSEGFIAYEDSPLVCSIHSLLGRAKDLFQLSQTCEAGVYLIFMFEKHILIFRTIQSNPGVAATPPLQRKAKKGLKSTLINLYLERGGGDHPWVTLIVLKINISFSNIKIRYTPASHVWES